MFIRIAFLVVVVIVWLLVTIGILSEAKKDVPDDWKEDKEDDTSDD